MNTCPPNLPYRPSRPGLFITATDTGVGKTVITCAIAQTLARRGIRVGLCKPIASGCRPQDDRLVSDDGLALSAALESPPPVELICPVRYAPPLAPAVAAELTGRPVDYQAIASALAQLEQHSQLMLVEGIGGWLVPLDRRHCLADLAVALGWPVLVVTRPNLGTLNHTALTCRAIASTGLPCAGLVINGCREDPDDPSILSNPAWLTHLCRADVLARVPWCSGLNLMHPPYPPALRQAIEPIDWVALAAPPTRLSPS